MPTGFCFVLIIIILIVISYSVSIIFEKLLTDCVFCAIIITETKERNNKSEVTNMRTMKLTKYDKAVHPSIHYTGSIAGMKKAGYWGKDDVIVRCGEYIYNLSIFTTPSKEL